MRFLVLGATAFVFLWTAAVSGAKPSDPEPAPAAVEQLEQDRETGKIPLINLAPVDI